MKKITIWHTSDVHSRFEKFIKIASYVKQNRNAGCDLFLDAGDFADTLSVMVSGSKGRGAMRLAEAAGVDAMAVGNNEFLAGVESLRAMASCRVPLLTCNLTGLDGSSVEGLRPYIILQRAGVRILIAGCCPFFWHVSFFTDNAGVKLLYPVEMIRGIIEKEKGNYDICILLSHGGRKRDLEIAEKVEGIDVIIGGHTHNVEKETETAFGKIIHQARCHAQSLGKLELYLDDSLKIRDFRAEQITEDVQTEAELEEILMEETRKAEEEYSKPLFTMSWDLSYDPFCECPAANAVADSLYMQYGGDLALINNGIINNGFSGEISRMFLLNTSPSILNPTTVWWRGKSIRQALLASFDRDFISRDGKGPGSRFNVLGALAVSYNVRVEYCPSSEGAKDGRLEVTVSGEPLDDERLYCVVADDYMYRGVVGYTMLKGSEKPEIYHKGYIRDMLETTLQDPDIIRHAAEKRIKIARRQENE